MSVRVSSSYPMTTICPLRAWGVLRGGVGASSAVRNGARRSGMTMKIMMTPEIMIWMASRLVRSLVNGRSQP